MKNRLSRYRLNVSSCLASRTAAKGLDMIRKCNCNLVHSMNEHYTDKPDGTIEHAFHEEVAIELAKQNWVKNTSGIQIDTGCSFTVRSDLTYATKP